jgi:hypothetical protein
MLFLGAGWGGIGAVFGAFQGGETITVVYER